MEMRNEMTLGINAGQTSRVTKGDEKGDYPQGLGQIKNGKRVDIQQFFSLKLELGPMVS